MNAQEMAEVAGFLTELSEIADEFLPAVQELGSKARPIFEDLSDFSVDMQVRMVTRYQDNGFSRKEAILMVLGNKQALRAIRNGAK